MLQQCGPPASFSNIQTAINKDQPANPTEGTSFSLKFDAHITYNLLKLDLLRNVAYLWLSKILCENIVSFVIKEISLL